MASLEAIRAELEKFGLSNKQAEIYLLLVSHGELRIQEIVKLSHTPRSSIYQSVKGLYELGIAEEIIDGSFKKVKACPIGVIQHELNERIIGLQQQLQNLANLETDIGLLVGHDTGPTNIRFYRARAGARQVYWNTLKSKDTVYVYTEWGRQQYVGSKFYESFAAENHKRGLKEKVLINLSAQTLASIKLYTLPGAPSTRTRIEDIRVIDAKNLRIKGDTMIYNGIYAQVYLRNVEIHGFEIDSQDFVETQRSIFETLWQSARPVANYLPSST